MLHSVAVFPAARALPRHARNVGCGLESNSGRERALLLDLNRCGARVRTGSAVSSGDEIILSLADERLGDRIEVLARVVHVQPSGDGFAAGLQFVHIDAEHAEHLSRSLRSVPPPLPARREPDTDLVWIDPHHDDDEDLALALC